MTHSLPTLPTFGYVPADPVRRAYAAFDAAQTAWAQGRTSYAAVRYAHAVYRAAMRDALDEQGERFPTGMPGGGR